MLEPSEAISHSAIKYDPKYVSFVIRGTKYPSVTPSSNNERK